MGWDLFSSMCWFPPQSCQWIQSWDNVNIHYSKHYTSIQCSMYCPSREFSDFQWTLRTRSLPRKFPRCNQRSSYLGSSMSSCCCPTMIFNTRNRHIHSFLHGSSPEGRWCSQYYPRYVCRDGKLHFPSTRHHHHHRLSRSHHIHIHSSHWPKSKILIAGWFGKILVAFWLFWGSSGLCFILLRYTW